VLGDGRVRGGCLANGCRAELGSPLIFVIYALRLTGVRDDLFQLSAFAIGRWFEAARGKAFSLFFVDGVCSGFRRSCRMFRSPFASFQWRSIGVLWRPCWW